MLLLLICFSSPTAGPLLSAVSGLDPQLRPSPFSWCWTPFCAVSGLDLPKRGAMAPLPFPAAWIPFCAVSGLDPPKRGPVTWLQICFWGHLFSSLTTQRRCTCVSSLSLCSFCVLPLLCVRELLFGYAPSVPQFAEHTFYPRFA